MVDRAKRTRRSVLLEERKIRHPQKTHCLLGNEIQPARDLLPHAIERRTGNPVRPRNKEAEIAFSQLKPRRCSLAEELRNRPFEHTIHELQTQQAKRTTL